MPELPEVETVVRALGQHLLGKRIDTVAFISRMRIPFDPEAVLAALAGKRITGVRRRAKYIVMDFNCRYGLLAHLGMTGFFHIEPSDTQLDKHDRVTFSLRGGKELRYADARRFGFVQLVDMPDPGCWPEALSHLGPEPLERAFSGKAMFERSMGRKGPVKSFIMDQTVVVGVGNIYASEALFAAGVDPRRAAGSLTLEEWNRVVAEIKAVLRRAIRSGGSTIRNYRTVDGTEGGFQRVLHVYGKAGCACPKCGGGVHAIRQGGRSTFFCPACQR